MNKKTRIKRKRSCVSVFSSPLLPRCCLQGPSFSRKPLHASHCITAILQSGPSASGAFRCCKAQIQIQPFVLYFLILISTLSFSTHRGSTQLRSGGSDALFRGSAGPSEQRRALWRAGEERVSERAAERFIADHSHLWRLIKGGGERRLPPGTSNT